MALLTGSTPRATPTLVVLVLLLVLAGAVDRSSALAPGPPRCFGAASRDPELPCVNPQLRLVVRPKPADAIIAPNAPCTQASALTAVPFVCSFGAPEATAEPGTVALLGDSHAAHWRPAVDAVAVALRRRALSVTRSSCPYSRLVTVLPEPTRSGCIAWVKTIPAWFSAHPAVTTVFVSAHAGARSEVPKGTRSMFEAQVRAYTEAWRRLPATVTHIIVLRDTPTNNSGSSDCVERAIAARERAGIACALPRNRILHKDPAATAARRLDSPRIRVADLTPFMCSPRLCFPVIGGALVHKDIDHLTEVFASTLGPYLQRRVAGWLTTSG